MCSKHQRFYPAKIEKENQLTLSFRLRHSDHADEQPHPKHLTPPGHGSRRARTPRVNRSLRPRPAKKMITPLSKSMARSVRSSASTPNSSPIAPTLSPKPAQHAQELSSVAVDGAVAKLSSAATMPPFVKTNFSIPPPKPPKFAPSSFIRTGPAAASAQKSSKPANPPPALPASRVTKWARRSPASPSISRAAIKSSSASKPLCAMAPFCPSFEWPSPIHSLSL